MSRAPIALTIADVSAFAKTLRAGLAQPPSHLETLGLIARAAGYRNYQHLRARHEETPEPVLDARRLDRAARHFDKEGRFARWPGKAGLQALSLWVIWAQLPPRTDMSERQISDRIDALCTFRDAAHIRRGMIEHRMFERNLDGSVYRRVEQAPPAEAQALLRRVLGGA